MNDKNQPAFQRPYIPSNGSEGCAFEAEFCDRCSVGNICLIIRNAHCGIQPEQWVEDDTGARCTSFTPRGGKRQYKDKKIDGQGELAL